MEDWDLGVGSWGGDITLGRTNASYCLPKEKPKYRAGSSAVPCIQLTEHDFLVFDVTGAPKVVQSGDTGWKLCLGHRKLEGGNAVCVFLNPHICV